MQELSKKTAEHLKPLQEEFKGYKFKYSCSFDSVIVEIAEQNHTHNDFVPISTKLFYQKANGDKIEFYIRVLQTTEIDIDRLSEIFIKVERVLRQYCYDNIDGGRQ